MMLVVTLLAVLGLVEAGIQSSSRTNSSCDRNVVYNVATLQQTNHGCQNGSQNNGGEIKDLRAQFAALQNNLHVLQTRVKSLEKNQKQCKEEALINGLNPVGNYQLSASSTHPECSVSRSRLHSQKTGRNSQPYGGAWCALSRSSTTWIKVTFDRTVQVTAIATQGRHYASDNIEWVTSYSVTFSKDGSIWTGYTEDGVVKIFGGNWNSDSVNKHHLKEPIRAKIIRLHPKTWQGWISMRWEVYGCYV